MDKDDVMGIFDEVLGKDSKHGYHCNKCDYGMETIAVKTVIEGTRRLFFCTNKLCERFGVITVVAIKKAKRV